MKKILHDSDAEKNFKFCFQNCRPDYLTVSKLQYMDMVVHENLRLHNIAAV